MIGRSSSRMDGRERERSSGKISDQEQQQPQQLLLGESVSHFGDGGGEMFFLYYYSDVDNLMATLLLSDGRRR
ncbi:hypothetical protein TYRP_011757 [Tyrophagus putrescentiae]|nr:hypothetical protein TYRP_011757 [Tyrophagus putrescentiae]